MADNLTSRGFPTTVLNLAGDLRADARRIAAAVDQTRRAHPGDRIALVGHSISGISSRWYLKEMGGTAKVATYIAIGTAQYGSPPSCTADIARENCPGSPFINRLNAGIDTPKPTVYFGIRSTASTPPATWTAGGAGSPRCRFPTSFPTASTITAEPLAPAIWDATAASLRGSATAGSPPQTASSMARTRCCPLRPGTRSRTDRRVPRGHHGRIVGMATLWAISDLHVGHRGNEHIVDRIHPAIPATG